MTIFSILKKEKIFELLSILIFLIINTLIYFCAPVIQIRFGHDVIYMMDGANRILNGQIPHNTFSTIVPSLNLYLLSFFLSISGFSSTSFFYVSIFFSTLVLFWTLFRLQKIKDNANRKVIFLFFILAFSFCFGLYHTGHSPISVTYANSYNRYGYALLVILIGELLFEFELYPTVLITSFILFMLFFTKQTYCFAGLIFLLIQLQKKLESKKMLLYILVVTLLMVICYIAITKINILLLSKDYLLPIIVKSKNDLKVKFFNKELLLSLFPIFLSSIFFAKHYKILFSTKYIKLIILTIFFSLFFHLTNYSFTEIPFLNLVVIIIIFILFDSKYEISNKYIIMISLPVIVYFFLNLYSVTYSIYKKNHSNIVLFESYKLRDLYIENADGYINTKYVKDINEGSKMLKKHLNPNNTIANLYFENPFTLSNNLNSANKQPLLWQYGMTYSDLYYPNKNIFFNTDYIILKKPLQEELDQRKILKIYHNVITSNFKIIDSSERWTLLKNIKLISNNEY
jgi:hypothetical protein